MVSRYIENPLLVNGHKFDLRIYVAVTSFYPLITYVYSEGLTRYQRILIYFRSLHLAKFRVASEKYCSEVDTQDAFVHLTNYSINKNNTNFVRCVGFIVCTLLKLFSYIKERDPCVKQRKHG